MNEEEKKWKWDFDTCPLCEGTGFFNGKSCKVCEGQGFWEFVTNDNHLAVKVLQGHGAAELHIVRLCNQRLAGITPDNIERILTRLQEGLEMGSKQEKERFDGLHKAGTKRWSWSWLHSNHFARELAILNNVDYVKFRYALTSLVFGWLMSEEKT
jgi:hypothetical protein